MRLRLAVFAVAAAVVLLLAWPWWDSGGRAGLRERGTLAEIHALERAAWRRPGDERWEAAGGGVPSLADAPFELAAAPARAAEVRGPGGGAEHVVLGAGGRLAALVPDGRPDAAGPDGRPEGSDAEGAPDGSGSARAPVASGEARAAEDVAFELADGRLRLVREAGGAPWEVRAAAVHLRLAQGELEVARAGERVEATLVRGSAEVLEDGRWRPFSSGVPEVLRGERVEVATPDTTAAREPAATGLAPADASGGSGAPDAEPAPADGGLVLRVVDAAGEPLSAFTVSAVPVRVLPDVGDPVVREASGLADGRLAIALEPGPWAVDVVAPGKALRRFADVAVASDAPAELEVLLEDGLSLRGVVLDPDGLPVEGAWLASELEVPPIPFATDRAELGHLVCEVATTDAAGRFEFTRLRPGEHVLRAAHPEHACGWSERFTLSPGASAPEPTIRLQHGGTVLGRVAHPDDTPWPDVTVLVCSAGALDDRSMSYSRVSTDARGEYRIDRLAPGPYVVLRFDDGSDPPQPELRFVEHLAAGDEARVDFVPDLTGRAPLVRVAGRLVLAGGGAAPQTGLALRPLGVPNPNDAQLYGFSGADGEFEFLEVPPGPYELYLSAREGMTVVRLEELDVPAWGIVDHELVLSETPITGTVTDGETGAPIQSVVVLVEIEEPGARGEFVGRAISGPDGRFELPRVPRGYYRLLAQDVRGRLGQRALEDVLPFEDGRPVDLTLYPGGSIASRVVDRDGAPIVGARLRFVDERGVPASFSEDDRTRASGLFQANGVAPGLWTVTATAEGFEGGSATVRVFADTTANATVVLLRHAPAENR